MREWRRPKQWKKLIHIDKRSPEWLAAHYRSTLVRAAAYARSRYPTFSEPMSSLLKSLTYEEHSPIFRKAVISVEAPPFAGGLHQTYDWGHIASVDWRYLGGEIIDNLESFLRERQREKAIEALRRLRMGTYAA